MLEGISKKSAVDEISRTVLYLLRGGESGRDVIDLSELLNTKLEKNILDNFDGNISKDEYEELIFRIFKDNELKIGNFYLSEIDSELEELLINQNIREKISINEKIIYKFNIPKEYEKNIKKYILWKYREIAKDYIGDIIYKKISDDMTKQDDLIKICKKEKFKINLLDIQNIINSQTKRYRRTVSDSEYIEQKSQAELAKKPRLGTAISRREKAGDEKRADSGTSAKEQIKQRQIKIVTDRFYKMKSRFIEKFCKTPKFEMIKNVVIDNKRHFIHRSIYGGREVYVTTISEQQDIENVIIEFKRLVRGKKKTEVIDVNEIKNLIESPNGATKFTRRLKLLSDILSFNNFQELVWFLGNFMTEYNNIPKKSAEYIKENFREHVENVDKTLLAYTIKRSIKL